ncbi:MAG: NAD(+) synthase [Oscillospiraceae bacterium]
MKDGFIKVAAATPRVRVADTEYNAAEIIALAKKAAEQGVKICVFPELCITAYTCGDLFLQPALLKGAEAALQRIAEETAQLDMLIAVGLPVGVGGRIYNCAAVLSRGSILGLTPKTHIPNYAEYYEHRWFAPAPEDVQFASIMGQSVYFGTGLLFYCESVPELIVGVEICEDLWTVTPPSNALASGGATVILNLSASNELVGKSAYRRELVKGQSARLLCAYIYADAGDGESTTDLVFSGHDMIAENGVMLGDKRLGSGLVISEIDVKRLAFERRKMTTFKEKLLGRAEIPFDLELTDTQLTKGIPSSPFVPVGSEEREERCKEIFSIQSAGLKKRMEHTGSKRMVVGVSGGLDSTLAMLVAAHTASLMGLPKNAVIAVTMPCFGTTERTKSNAVRLSEKLGAELRVVDIGPAVMQHFKDIGHDPENHNVVFENSQARERTQVIMDIANAEGGILVGTGDLSELALGWATYNGDHMSMYGVNAGVPKTLVRYVVGWYSEICGDGELAGVLNDILATPVSPELLPAENGEISQKTEDIVGPYELHDFFLYYFVRCGYEPEKILRLAEHSFTGVYGRDVILKWLKTFIRRFFQQQFKRSCLPDGPKVGSICLSPRGDWRMPSDAVCELWLKRLEGLQ